ncbi:uncharacterized protein LOC111086836 [Limulus polyphemus]|uniref:Uncharacterized protein LOC111086836 n=1 Tax=Limulus polyphemus TaxID=6850 RepID=A0ABM1STT4_LIMPO|nr:uncharacterized protein LOC111086836 [Limulus polyphemus]
MCFSNFADLLEHVITEERNVPVSACISAKRIKTTHENETYSSLHFASSKLGVIQNNEEIVSVPGNVLKLESDSECFVTEDPIIPVNLHYSTGKEYDLLDDNLDEGIDNSVQNPLPEGYRKPPVFSSSISQNEQLFCESKTLESIDHCEPERLSESQSNFDEAESTYLKSPVFMDVTDDNLPFSVFEIHPGPHVSPGADTLLTNISHISEAQSIPLSYSMTSTSVSKSPKCLLNNPQYKLKNQDSASFRIPTGDDEDLVDINTTPNISAFKMYETKLYKCFYCDAGPYSLQKLQQHWQKRHVDAKFFVKNMFLESPVIEYRCSYCMGKEKSLAMVRQHCKHCHPNFPVKFIKTRLVDCVPKSVPWIYEAQKICDL